MRGNNIRHGLKLALVFIVAIAIIALGMSGQIVVGAGGGGGGTGATGPSGPSGPSGATGPAAVSCQPGLGDGLNAIASGTYLESTCRNTFGSTLTITSVKCFSDNNGTSTMNVTNGAGTALLTGAITCTSSFASGTQGATVTLAANDYLKFTFVADGTTLQSSWVVAFTR